MSKQDTSTEAALEIAGVLRTKIDGTVAGAFRRDSANMIAGLATERDALKAENQRLTIELNDIRDFVTGAANNMHKAVKVSKGDYK